MQDLAAGIHTGTCVINYIFARTPGLHMFATAVRVSSFRHKPNGEPGTHLMLERFRIANATVMQPMRTCVQENGPFVCWDIRIQLITLLKLCELDLTPGCTTVTLKAV